MEIDIYQKEGVTILKPDGNIFGVAALDFKRYWMNKLLRILNPLNFWLTLPRSHSWGVLGWEP